MSVMCGRVYTLWNEEESPDYQIAKVKNLSIAFGTDTVDISNKDSGGWQSILENCGLKKATISLDGLLDRGVGVNQSVLFELFLSGASNAFRIESTDGYISGNFVVVSYDEGSGYNDAVTFSASLESNSAVTYTAT